MRLCSYDYQAARKAGWLENFSIVRELIARRSYPYVHSEIQFGERYGYISFSATMEDKAKGCRFKDIGYSSGYWAFHNIPVTKEKEDLCFLRAMCLAGLSCSAQEVIDTCKDNVAVYGKTAKKYDLLGLLSFATPLEVIVPNRDRYWCSEACATVIQAGVSFNVQPDRLHPTELHRQARLQF